MKTILTLALLLVSLVANGQEILPADKGTTLAQTTINGNVHTLLVIAEKGENIEAIDLSNLYQSTKDMIGIYHDVGYQGLVTLSLANTAAAQLYPISDLLSPAGTHSHHVAAGLNYRKHADEVDSEQVPFLYVKATKPTRQQSITVNAQELLDYEVELCARPLRALTVQPQQNEPTFGFFLCGDFTDRAELLRHIDIDNMQSGRGFSNAKSKQGYFPTGPYMVISKDWQQFINNTELKLSLNGQLKQNAMAKEMVWSLSKMLEKTWQLNKNNYAVHSNKVGSLSPNKTIDEKMVFLTGTPEGILFGAPGVGFKIKTAIKYVFTGNFCDMKLTDFVLKEYSRELLEEKTLLQPGDEVILSASYLGQIQLTITGAP